MAELVDALLPLVLRELDRPFAFFGHSLGGLVAHAVCARLHAEARPLPARLFVSSVPAPTFRHTSVSAGPAGAHAPLSPLDDDSFVREAFARGWFPKEAVENAELRAVVLPALRADMAVYDGYRAECAAASESKTPLLPLDGLVVIEAFGGGDDVSVPPAALSSWNPARTHITPGAGHFHTETHPDVLLPRVLASLRAVLAKRPPSVSMGKYIRFPTEAFCCHEIFERQAHATPDAVCVVDARRGSLSFAQVLAESHLLARRLQEGGVGPGLDGVVGVLSSPSADFMIAMFAVWRAGGAVLPFYINYTKELIEDLVGSANVAFMLVDGDPHKGLAASVPVVLAEAGKSFALVDGWAAALARRDPAAATAAAAANKDDGASLPTSPLDFLRDSFFIRSDRAAANTSASASATANSDTEVTNSVPAPLPPLRTFDAVTPESIALMAMTSGSSGKPKAIVVSHRATIVSFAARWEMLPYNEHDVLASNIFFVWEAIRGPMQGVSFRSFSRTHHCPLPPSLHTRTHTYTHTHTSLSFFLSFILSFFPSFPLSLCLSFTLPLCLSFHSSSLPLFFSASLSLFLSFCLSSFSFFFLFFLLTSALVIYS
jgi:surfactin synthase thioesterase subunit